MEEKKDDIELLRKDIEELKKHNEDLKNSLSETIKKNDEILTNYNSLSESNNKLVNHFLTDKVKKETVTKDEKEYDILNLKYKE